MFSIFKKEEVDPAPILKEAICELASEEYLEQGMLFFDDYQIFTDLCLDQGDYEPSWSADQYVPSKAEVAFEVLFYFLIEKDFLGNIDWAAGEEEIVEEYNRLLRKRNLDELTSGEIKDLSRVSQGCKRGEVYMKCFDRLGAIARDREMVIGYYQMGWDAYLPIILKENVHKKWIKVKFGRKFPVIP